MSTELVIALSGLFISIVAIVLGEVRSYQDRRRQATQQRKEFLTQIFLDKFITRSARKPAYEEYVMLGGNGVCSRLWMEEGGD